MNHDVSGIGGRNMKQPIAIGVENYKRIIDKNAYFVDKTMMIK